jgi:hypothetical protein
MLPESWLYEAIEAAAGSGVEAYPVSYTGGGEPPYVVFQRASTQPQLVLQDELSETPELDAFPRQATYTVEIYADGYLEAREIAQAVSDALHRFTGPMDYLTIEHCLLMDDRDSAAVYLEGREVPTYIVEQTYQIAWSE